jgi:hypothetical protein
MARSVDVLYAVPNTIKFWMAYFLGHYSQVLKQLTSQRAPRVTSIYYALCMSIEFFSSGSSDANGTLLRVRQVLRGPLKLTL